VEALVSWLKSNALGIVTALVAVLVALGVWSFDAGSQMTEMRADIERASETAGAKMTALQSDIERTSETATFSATQVTALQLRVVVLETERAAEAERSGELREIGKAVVRLGAAVEAQGKILEVLTQRLLRGRDHQRRTK
jgi:predicted negative regulator of RcsB-dependent stress response